MNKGAVLFALISLTGCATLTSTGEGVQVVTEDIMKKNCQKLGEIELNTQFGVPNYSEAAISEARNQAGALGANSIYIKKLKKDVVRGATIHAIALRCE